MTELLNQAFQEASKLPIEDQDAVARWIIEELQSERGWSQVFASSQKQLSLLARRAMAEHKKGLTQELDPEKL